MRQRISGLWYRTGQCENRWRKCRPDELLYYMTERHDLRTFNSERSEAVPCQNAHKALR